MKKKKSKYTAKFMTDEGGSSCFYILKESKTLGFKEFDCKEKANSAYKIQVKLSQLGLSPKVYGKVCKINIETRDFNGDAYLVSSGWGFITQKVKVKKRLSLKKIQKLVDDIKQKAELSFWDCHEYNIGIYRNKYVCIDTGKESFHYNCDAWGLGSPGPLCPDCNKVTCNCNFSKQLTRRQLEILNALY